LAVSGGSFAVFQFTFATIHAYVPSIVVYPMTDIGGGIFSLIVTALFLKVWRPQNEWHFKASPAPAAPRHAPAGGHEGHGAAVIPDAAAAAASGEDIPLNWKTVSLAWAPYGLMSALLMLTGWVRQMEGEAMKHGQFVSLGPVQTNYLIPVPAL